jgi:hypothetical protein
MRLVIVSLFLVAGTTVFSQTKRIAFKSHSGSNTNFRIALANNLFDMGGSDFGVAPQRTIKTAQLDSVIFVSDTMAILVTSQYCTLTDRDNDKPLGNPKLWKAGREFAYNHPLFSKRHSLDSIKKVIKEQYHFKNSVEKVVFIGFDNKKPKKKKRSKEQSEIVLPVTGNSNDKNYPGMELALMLGGVVAVSLLLARLSYRKHQLPVS